MIGTGDGVSVVRAPLFWVGFAAPALVYSLNALHAWIPSLPTVPITFTLNDYFTSLPWNTIVWTPIVLHPRVREARRDSAGIVAALIA